MTDNAPRDLVFVVDDDSDVLELLEASLTTDFEVRPFATASELIVQVDQGALPQAIVADLVMPQIDGIELLRQLRDRQFSHPVIVCTGHADKEKSIQALNLHAYALIEKPFLSRELVNLVKNAVFESKLLKLNKRLLGLNTELCRESDALIMHYESRLASAEELVVKGTTVAKSDFFDPHAYLKEFQHVCQKIDLLKVEIEVARGEQERLLEWWKSPT